jgi:hypothetical protein
MATTYTFRFTDPLKSEFYVAAYTGDGWENPNSSSTLMLNADGNTATSANTTLKLYGKGMPEYGQGVMQDLIYVLENFANSESPKGAIEGQLWYDNINNVIAVTHDDGTTWDNLILASGNAVMTGDLDMGSNNITNLAAPATGSDAVTLAYANANYINATGDNISGNLNFISGADLVMNSTGAQVQLDDGTVTDPALTFLSDTNSGMYYVGADSFAFTTGGIQRLLIASSGLLSVGTTANYETLVLSDDDVPNKKYVDDEITAAVAGTELSDVTFEDTVTGSPIPTYIVADKDVMVLEIGGIPTFYVQGLDYATKLKPASLVSFVPAVGITSTDVQAALVEVKTTQLDKTGDFMTGVLDMSSNRITSVGDPILGSDAVNKSYVDNVGTAPDSRVFLTDSSPVNDTYTVYDNAAGSSNLQVFVNGQKNYANTYAQVELGFSRTIAPILSENTLTYLDETVLDYNFDVTIDGGSPTINVSIPLDLGSGSPPTLNSAGTTIGSMLVAINSQLSGNGIEPLTVSGFNNALLARGPTAGSTSSLVFSDSGTGTYLFDIPAGLSVTAINYTAGSPFGADVGSPIGGSPFVYLYDSFEVDGDQTSSFPIGRKFTLLNTTTDDTDTPNIDGVYTVVSATTTASPVTTVIEVEEEIWQDGTVTSLGEISLTNIAGLISNVSTSGLDIDYQELDLDGNVANIGEISTQIRFNSVPPAGEVVEIIKVT